MTISLIAAVSDNGVIGKDGDLPWNIPEDLKRFMNLTKHHPIIMGKNTYYSFGKNAKGSEGLPLAKRQNIIVSSKLEEELEGSFKRSEDSSFLIPVETRSGKKINRRSYVAESPEKALEIAKYNNPENIDNSEIYIIGGESIYEKFLPKADKLELTQIHGKFEGDTYFPKVDWNKWEEGYRDGRFKDTEGSGEEYSFVTFERSSD